MPFRLSSAAKVRLTFVGFMLALAAALIIAPQDTGARPLAPIQWQSSGPQAPFAQALQRLSFDPPIWSPNVRANTDNSGNGQHEPSLAVSFTDPNVVIVANKDYRTGNIKRVWIEGSTDGGQTWPVQLHMPNLPTTENESDPVVIARDDGRIYVACLTTGNNGVFITWTDDRGATWQPSVAIVQNQSSLQDKDWFAVDNNPTSPYYHRMYMMYAPGAANVVEQHSTDGGLTWTTRQSIGGSNTEYTYPVVGSDGTVYNFMMQNWGGGQVGTVQLTKSTNGGVSWSTPTLVSSAFQPNSPPRAGDNWRFFSIISAAVDPVTHALYAAWSDSRNFSTNGIDVLYVKSTDRGATWSTPARLSHDPTGVVRDHITPVLDIDPGSRLHAFWLDRRLDPANHLFQGWYSSSTDGGATWEPDSQVSDAPGLGFDLNLGFPPGSGNAAGDYWGLDAMNGIVYAAWTDTRNNEQDIYTSRGVRVVGSVTVTPTAVRTSTPTVTSTAPVQTGTATLIATASATPTATGMPNTPSVTATSVVGTPTSTATGTPPTATATSTATAPPAATNTPTRTVTPCAMTFSDVHQTDYFYEPVRYLYCAGVISGYADNTFRPYSETTRGQLSKIVVLAEGFPINTAGGPHFTDVPATNPFYSFIETAYNRGLISGYSDGTFRWGNNVTRGQLSKIVVLAEGWPINTTGGPHFTDVPSTDPFYSYIETAYNHGIISGYSDGTFRPGNSATRGQISKIVYGAVTGP